MKRLLSILFLLTAFAVAGQAQTGCVELKEIDGSPDVKCVKTIRVTNGTLSCSGNVCTITISGGGGGTPGGSDTQLQYNNAGSFGGITGATTNGTIVTLTSPVLVTPAIGVATGTSLTVTGNMQVGIAALYKFGGSNSLSYTDSTGPKFTDGNTTRDLIFNVQSLSANRTVTWPDASGTVAFTSGLPAGANPTASVGLSAVNGVATTFMRSDGAPALDQSIAPTWTGIHTFNNGVTTGTGGTSGTVFSYNSLTTGTGANLSSSSVTSGSIVNIASTSTAGATGVEGLNIAMSGANGTNGQTVTGQTISVTNTNATSGTNVGLAITASGATTDNVAVNVAAGRIVQTSASATAFESGPNGGTNPVFRIVNSTASQADGVSVTGAAAGSGTTFTAISSGSNAGLIFTPKGSGVIQATSNSNGDAFRAGSTSTLYINDGGAGPSFVFAKNTGRVTPLLSFQTRANLGVIVAPGNGMFGFGSWTATFSEGTDVGIVRNAAGALRINDGATSGTPNTTAGNLIMGTSAGAIGSSGAGVVAFTLSTAPSSSPTDTVQLYSGDAAAADHNLYTRNEAGEINRLTGLAARNSAQFDKTNTTLANVTGLTRNVEAGRTYSFRAVIQTVGDAAGGVKLAVSGTATATAISYVGVLADGTSIIANTRATALDTTVCASSTSTTGTCTIDGTIQVNAAGTLTIQFAQNNASGTSSVLANQLFQLIPIT